MIDSELSTDLRRPCTPSRGPGSPTPRNLRFRGDPGSAVLAHPLTNGLAPVLGAGPRSGAPGHRISRRQSESIIWRLRSREATLTDRPTARANSTADRSRDRGGRSAFEHHGGRGLQTGPVAFIVEARAPGRTEEFVRHGDHETGADAAHPGQG